MSKLTKNTSRYFFCILATLGLFCGLAILKLIQISLGLDEQEFYQRYPIGWWVAAILGLSFIVALIGSVIMAIATNPNIQLRDRSDEAIQNVLDDPEYELWHSEAQRQLHERRLPHLVKKKCYTKYAIAPVVVLLVFMDFAVWGMRDSLKVENGGIVHVAGLYFYMATGLLAFMISGDRIRRVKLSRFRIPLSVLRYVFFFFWFIGSAIWMVYIFGF